MSTEITSKKPKFSMVISSNKIQSLVNNTLGDKKKAERYTAAITSAVATNSALQECEASSIISGSLLAESLNLSHSPQLGRYYLVPFKDKKSGITKAQFILGYKGYIELAVRSGQYKHINALPIKDGELVSYDPFNDEIQFKAIQDPDEREKAKTIGYYAMFEYLNGFRKVLYWSKKQMIRHADRYSPAFSAKATGGKYPKVSFDDYEAGRYDKNDEWLYYSFWYKDFDGMACKTMLRQLISKWGIMSADMQQAFTADNAVVEAHENGIFSTVSVDESTEAEHEVVKAETVAESNGEINIDEL